MVNIIDGMEILSGKKSCPVYLTLWPWVPSRPGDPDAPGTPCTQWEEDEND